MTIITGRFSTLGDFEPPLNQFWLAKYFTCDNWLTNRKLSDGWDSKFFKLHFFGTPYCAVWVICGRKCIYLTHNTSIRLLGLLKYLYVWNSWLIAPSFVGSGFFSFVSVFFSLFLSKLSTSAISMQVRIQHNSMSRRNKQTEFRESRTRCTKRHNSDVKGVLRSNKRSK